MRNIKKYILILLILIVSLSIVLTSCDGSGLFESTWKLSVLENGKGQVIDYGEDYDSNGYAGGVSYTCKVKPGNNIVLINNKSNYVSNGKMYKEWSADDGSAIYSVIFDDNMKGTLIYLKSKYSDYPDVLEKEIDSKNFGNYELTLIIEDSEVMYFVRA